MTITTKTPTLLFCLALSAGCGAAARERPGISDPLDTIAPEELYARGVELGRAGDFIRAEQYIAAAIERGFSEERAMPALLAACIEASRLSSALSYAEPYLARHPSQWSLRLLVASIHMGLQQHQRARLELVRVLRDAPDEPPEAHYFLGVLHRDELSDPESAQEHFRRYLALAPEGPHRDEAVSALPDEERAALGVPVRVRGEGSVPVRIPHRDTTPVDPTSNDPTSNNGASP